MTNENMSIDILLEIQIGFNTFSIIEHDEDSVRIKHRKKNQ